MAAAAPGGVPPAVIRKLMEEIKFVDEETLSPYECLLRAEELWAALEPAEHERLRKAGVQQAAEFSEVAMGEAAWAALPHAVRV